MGSEQVSNVSLFMIVRCTVHGKGRAQSSLPETKRKHTETNRSVHISFSKLTTSCHVSSPGRREGGELHCRTIEQKWGVIVTCLKREYYSRRAKRTKFDDLGLQRNANRANSTWWRCPNNMHVHLIIWCKYLSCSPLIKQKRWSVWLRWWHRGAGGTKLKDLWGKESSRRAEWNEDGL